jgi:cellulose synthase/poly-beta-1,6-N-acetylglucosamine synthase-like glycosyltransferase
MVGVSFVIPVRNGARWLDRVLTAIHQQHWTGPVEIIAIDDGSTDGSAAILSRHASRGGASVLSTGGAGAAAALNLGVRAATHPLIAQVDQDVLISPAWLAHLVPAFDDPQVAAAQGRYVPAPQARDIFSRVMALDVALRYLRLSSTTNHVCTGNSVYRRTALLDVGLFDETLGYGYDNDLSYRLTAAGYRLAFCREAQSVHDWREGITGYARQQYGLGYGRLDLLARHPHRLAGDDVSRLPMMLQAPATGMAILATIAAVIAAAIGARPSVPAVTAVVLSAAIVVDRSAAGLSAAIRFRDTAGLWFVPVHLVRNLSWLAATITWIIRRLSGRQTTPSHSMRPRPGLSQV